MGVTISASRKSNGTFRLCIDYWRLNQATIQERHILPTLEEITAKLDGAGLFSVLNPESGFHQIPLSAESRKYTTFSMHCGLHTSGSSSQPSHRPPNHFMNWPRRTHLYVTRRWEDAFNEAKGAMGASVQKLAYFQSAASVPTAISSDVSLKGLGAMLWQHDRHGHWLLVAGASRSLTETETRYSHYRERCWEVFAVTQFQF